MQFGMNCLNVLQTTNGDVDALLDRAASERSAAMAGPCPDADGIASSAVQLYVLGGLRQPPPLVTIMYIHHLCFYFLMKSVS